jgi:hypothetical protein
VKIRRFGLIQEDPEPDSSGKSQQPKPQNQKHENHDTPEESPDHFFAVRIDGSPSWPDDDQ